MRKIIFRGKTKCTNQWIYGCLINIDTCQINCESVFTYSVGQFTGLTDKNGIKIFDGDIVRFYDDSEDELTNGVVVFNADFCSFCVSMKGHEDVMLMAHWQYEAIGNIYDNKELLA